MPVVPVASSVVALEPNATLDALVACAPLPRANASDLLATAFLPIAVAAVSDATVAVPIEIASFALAAVCVPESSLEPIAIPFLPVTSTW